MVRPILFMPLLLLGACADRCERLADNVADIVAENHEILGDNPFAAMKDPKKMKRLVALKREVEDIQMAAVEAECPMSQVFSPDTVFGEGR
jgi:uncharacterized protein (UPF0335 family)